MPPVDPKAGKPKVSKPIPVDVQLCTIRLTPDGTRLFGGSFEGTINPFDVSTGTPVAGKAIAGHSGWVNALAIPADGKSLVSADSFGRITHWDIAKAEPAQRWSTADAHDGWIHGLAIVGDTAVTVGRDRKIRVTRLDKGELVRTIETPANNLAVAAHPSGQSFATGDAFGVVKHWDAATGKMINEFDAKQLYFRDRIQDVGGVRCLSFDRDGKRLFAGGSAPKTGGFVTGVNVIITFDTQSAKAIHQYKGTADTEVYVCDLAWHATNILMGVTSGQPGQGKFFAYQPGEAAFAFSTPIPNPHAIAPAPDGKRIWLCATNANSAGNGRPNTKDKSYPGNSSPLYSVDLS